MSSAAQSYRDLIVWRKGIELVKSAFALIDCFPRHEHFALADQMRRSAVSVPPNIAEGQARRNSNEFRQYLYVALGSAAELDTQAVIASELGYITPQQAAALADQIVEIRKTTYSPISHLPKTRP